MNIREQFSGRIRTREIVDQCFAPRSQRDSQRLAAFTAEHGVGRARCRCFESRRRDWLDLEISVSPMIQDGSREAEPRRFARIAEM
jgi:hypothetical protein